MLPSLPRIPASLTNRLREQAEQARKAKEDAIVNAPIHTPQMPNMPGLGKGGANPKLGLGKGGSTRTDTDSGFDFLAVAPKEGQPTWQTITNAKGEIDPKFLLQKEAPIEMDQRAGSAIRDRALASGDSPWASMQIQQNEQVANTNRENLAQQSATQRAQATNNLAMRGGVSGGARERIAREASKNQMMGNQTLGRDLSNQNLQTRIADDQAKMNALNSTVGFDKDNANLAGVNRDYSTGINQKNLSSLLTEVDSKRAFDMGLYKERMALLGAERTANAQAGASKGKK